MNVKIDSEEVIKLIKEYYVLMIGQKKNVVFSADAINVKSVSKLNNKPTFIVTTNLFINNEIRCQMIEELNESDVKRIIKKMFYLKETEKIMSIKSNYYISSGYNANLISLESVDVKYKDKKMKIKTYKKNNISN